MTLFADHRSLKLGLEKLRSAAQEMSSYDTFGFHRGVCHKIAEPC